MLIQTVEYDARNSLLSLVEEINSQQAAAWGLVSIKRSCLRDFTNGQLVLAIKPALQEVSRAKIFFMESETVYVSWFGLPRQTYQKITAICHLLMRPEVTEKIETVVSFLDPMVMGDELHMQLNSQNKKTAKDATMRLGTDHTNAPPGNGEIHIENMEFLMTEGQSEQFKRQIEYRPSRQRLNILIVEDQSFLRNLLSEVLRAAYDIEVASNIKEGWDMYLDKAPDIMFLDIGLPDGSGHALANKVKEIDPLSYVVMVTVSNQMDDVELAKQNHVDGFIIKPFNKKKISDCIGNYMSRKITAKKKN